MKLLSTFIARALLETDGLVACYFPEAIDPKFAQTVVQVINESVPQTPPLGILIADQNSGLVQQSLVPIVTANEAIRYRQGRRISIILGKRPNLKSFVSAFRPVITPDFPETRPGEVTFEKLATLITDDISKRHSVGAAVPLTGTTESLRRIFEVLRSVHRLDNQATKPWNLIWFDHVDAGLKSLETSLDGLVANDDTRPVDAVLQQISWSCFGLPQPENGTLMTEKSVETYAKSVRGALAEYWSDQNSVAYSLNSLQQMKQLPESSKLLDLDWDRLEEEVITCDSLPLAFSQMLASQEGCIEEFQKVTLAGFTLPIPVELEDRPVKVSNLEGKLTPFSGREVPDQVWWTFGSVHPETGDFVSEEIKVQIPHAISGSKEFSVSELNVTLVGPKVEFIPTAEVEYTPETLIWKGVVTAKGTQGQFKLPTSPLKIKIDRSQLVSTVGSLVSGQQFRLLLVPNIGPTLYSSKFQKSRLGTPKLLWPLAVSASSLITEESLHRFPMVAGQQVDFSLFSGSAPIAQTNIKFEQDDSGILCGRSNGNQDVEFTVGNETFEGGLEVSTREIHSPLIAAIEDASVSETVPTAFRKPDVRLTWEREFIQVFNEEKPLGFSHLISSESTEDSLQNIQTISDGSFSFSEKSIAGWLQYQHMAVPSELLESSERYAFEDAFKRLDFDFDGVEVLSKMSFAHLYMDLDLLNGYLDAYVNLVAKAREIDDPLGIFWASYPFSMSVWQIGQVMKCQGVLMSPLHPIRLAWLSSIEYTFAESTLANLRELAGITEGAHFPKFGPRHSTSGLMMSLQMEVDEHEVLSGWSLLVPVGVEDPEILSSPENYGNIYAPSTSSNGLNGGAVGAALRNFRQVHPHVSSLTIDLPAKKASIRAHDIDKAILSAGMKWPDLPGGLQVWESVHRSGSPAQTALDSYIETNERRPISWRRYAESDFAPRSNLKFIQNSGSSVAVLKGHRPGMSRFARVPLRRFEGPSEVVVSSRASKSYPSLHPEQLGWAEFTSAIKAIEGPESRQLSTRINSDDLLSDSSDWTVCGESLLAPNALAAIVSKGTEGKKTLWEWMPPHLTNDVRRGSDQVGLLNQRPYFSIAKIPVSFSGSLSDLVAKTQSETPDFVTTQILQVLGKRGIGLSSLLAMGGSHAIGAIGFYFAFQLIEVLEENNCEVLALPLDACTPFLTALAANSEADPGVQQRADLLLITRKDGVFFFTPVEIKVRNYDGNQQGNLPVPDSRDLAGPLSQLASTNNLLKGVIENWDLLLGGANGSDELVWRNAFATLIETGLKLQSDSAPGVSLADKFLSDVLTTDFKLSLGTPVILYLTGAENEPEFQVHPRYVPQNFGDSELQLITDSLSNLGKSLKDRPDGFEAAILGAFRPSRPDAGHVNDVFLPTEEMGTQPGQEVSVEMTEPWQNPAGDAMKTSANVTTPVDRSKREVLSDPVQPAADNSLEMITGDGMKFPIGVFRDQFGSRQAFLWPANTNLTQLNMGVVGDLGTGKTQLLLALLYNIRVTSRDSQQAPVSALIFDYKRDFQDPAFLQSVGGKVLPAQRIPLNLFKLDGPYSRTEAYNRIQEFVDTLKRIYSGIGEVQKQTLVEVIIDLYESSPSHPPRLSEILESYKRVAKTDSVTGILSGFVMREIFDDGPSAVTFDELIGDDLLVVALSSIHDSDGKNAVVALFLNLYYKWMLGREKSHFKGHDPQLRTVKSFLVIDEALNTMKYEFEVLEQILLQGREFGVGVILSTQYLSHFNTTSVKYAQPLLSWFIHKVPSVNMRDLRALGITADDQDLPDKISNLEKHEMIYTTFDVRSRWVMGTPHYKLIQE